jgi:hypothetical protein
LGLAGGDVCGWEGRSSFSEEKEAKRLLFMKSKWLQQP